MQLAAAVEAYFSDLKRVAASGGATGERSAYAPLAALLNAIGATLKPKVFCVVELADQGAGHPDVGLFTAQQVQTASRRPRDGQLPERGVVEAKALADDAWLTAQSDQVSRYWGRYRLVLVTNFRHFVLLGEDAHGQPSRLETFKLAGSAEEFTHQLQHPRAFAKRQGTAFGEYLRRALTYRATIAEPRDVAQLLASYARDGLARMEAAGDAPALAAVRSALEEALGVRFEGGKGVRFFHSALVQTLFYGIFSAWVLWSRQPHAMPAVFNWREAVWHLRAPVLRALFQQISDPGRLQPLGLVEVLDWTAAALDRVDRTTFFARFNEGEAVPYFYEPFLQAFDPDLRKQLGVWYTPTEVVRYMVARVDRALKDDLGISDGLAADNVYVLDPCCGTGAYLAEVLRRIAANLESAGVGALVGARVRQAATNRVFGFEIMPAPFVVAHLQVGLTLQTLDAPLSDDGNERAGIFLTNALTGWEAEAQPPLPFPELEEERDRAKRVKQDTPILVILGNPPYNGFAGVAVEEERELSTAYRTTRRVRRPKGRGLNDLYVRFFRMAERRIAERTGQGVVCFISNYSWLDGLSFTGMRERYLDAFDTVRIDCLNGDKYKTGKVAPDGSPDPSIFSTEGDPVGIQVGTAIATLVRKADHQPAQSIGFRHLWGRAKRETLLDTAEAEPDLLSTRLSPPLSLGLPFGETAVSDEWFDWPSLPELFPVSFPGVKTSRDGFLVDTDLARLRDRIGDYFDPAVTSDDMARRHPTAMRTTGAFDGRTVRDQLLARGGPYEDGFVRFAYRPLDSRWVYWEPDSGLLDRPGPEYQPHVFGGNMWLPASPHLRRDATEPQACLSAHLASLHLIERGALLFPLLLRHERSGEHGDGFDTAPNLSAAAQRYLARLGLNAIDLFHHVLAVLHDPRYRQANAGALRLEWPRIPLPGWPNGANDQAAETITASANRGRELAHLLDPDTPVAGVTQGALRPELANIAVPCTVAGRNMAGEDFAVTASWGRKGAGDAVMPGPGRHHERTYAADEPPPPAARPLGETTFDVHLNDNAYWGNVPANVWNYRLGGYQVLKKWLSYREHTVLDRPLKPEEVQYFADAARRIAAILLLTATTTTDEQR